MLVTPPPPPGSPTAAQDTRTVLGLSLAAALHQRSAPQPGSRYGVFRM